MPGTTSTTAGGRRGRRVRPALLALDFDGTVKSRDRESVGRAPIQGLARLRRAGTKLVLATGRCIAELEELMDISLFDAVVAENGTVILIDGKKEVVAPRSWGPVRAELMKHFERGCEEVVISMDRDHEAMARQVVHDVAPRAARLEVNKNRIMVVPKGFDKGTGLAAAVMMLRVRGRIASVGDGENDLPMFKVSDYSVALDNSVDSLKKAADYTTSRPDGEGVVEAIDLLFGPASAGGRPRAGMHQLRNGED
jgi:phosphoglycolate phosphatase